MLQIKSLSGFTTNWTLYQLRHHLLLSCMWPAIVGNSLSPGMDAGRVSGNPTASSKHTMPRRTPLRAATQSLAPRLFDCKHDFPGVTSVFEMGYFCQLPATYSRYLSLEFLPVSPIHQLSSRTERRLHLSGAGTCSILSALEQHPLHHCHSLQAAAPHPTPGSWPKLAPSPISRSLASA
jgi:hypothetical protein